ncbi:unnamed protein product [Polarella glacialis]|uniref:Uncharacterized protein n=2 Tax=Polarella glacialis TaxID=89957 RepID=A0A813LHK8_POLGL|nr:unnamed protein product [Polarella glacialis]
MVSAAAARERSRSPPADAKAAAAKKDLGQLWGVNVGSVPVPKPGESVTAPFTYQGDEVPRGLLASGKVGTKRDGSGSDGDYFGCDFVRRDCTVTNGRGRGFNLDNHGFQLVDSGIEHTEYFNNDKVLNEYYPKCCELGKRMTGAETVYAFDHNLRSKAMSDAKKMVDGGNAVQGPAFVVHNDYSVVSAPRRARDLALPPKMNDTLRPLLGDTPLIDPTKIDELLKGRWAIINVWRNIRTTPVQKLPLGLCEGPTIPMSDVITFEIHYADRVGENYFAAHSKEHQWFYFPEITRDEAVLLKCWDSAGEAFAPKDGSTGKTVPATFSFHSAFEDPSSKADAEDRESVEVRTIAFFPAES